MKRSKTATITMGAHQFRQGDVITLPDGRQWTVEDVYSDTTVTLRRRSWWRSLLRSLWPFRLRGFWRRVWER